MSVGRLATGRRARRKTNTLVMALLLLPLVLFLAACGRNEDGGRPQGTGTPASTGMRIRTGSGTATVATWTPAPSGQSGPAVQPGDDQLRAMLLTAEDFPPGFVAGKIHTVIPADTPNLRVQLESVQPPLEVGELGCITSYVALLSSAELAADAVRGRASQHLASDVPGTTERLDPPDIGDETVAVFTESPVYGLGSCGTRRVTGVTKVVFSHGEIFASVEAYTAEGKPSSDEVWEIARKQLHRVERALGTVPPETGD